MSAPSSRYFKYFLVSTADGLCYYIDTNGNLKKGNIVSGIDYSLPQDPIGWEDIQISYARNQTYWGVNRSFTIPLKFVGDGATIIRSLFYMGRGTEQPITLLVCKWDENQGAFVLYYKGLLDLTANQNLVAESITANVMEGGILQLLKSYENTVIEIPCNGSIPENIKFLADGIEFNDVFHYQILKITSPFAGDQPLPMIFLSNDGTNIGISHSDQQLENPYTGYYQKSSNFLFTSISPVTVRLTGSISVKSDPTIPNTIFYMYAVTSLAQPRGVGDTDHAYGLVTPQNPQPTDTNPFFVPAKSQVLLNGQQTYSFDMTINLAANENLFIFYFNDFTATPVQILGGTMDITFNSRLAPSRVWGITAANVWKLIGKNLCALASTTDYPFTFPFTSDFLQSLERIVITSGDAIRASTNPNYFQYFNQATLNPLNPNNTAFDQFATQGPTIKISLSDFFNSINPVKPSAIGNQNVNGTDAIFFENRKFVLNDSAVTLALPQVANFNISPDSENMFNWLEIGYAANDYDEASGKYEYNNTSQFQAAVKAMAKVFQLISKAGRTDSHGFELTRYNTQGGKSTTFNQSDSSWWMIDVDFSSFTNDYFKALFTSQITNTASVTNTNINLIKGLNYQPVICGTLDGEYFINGNDFSIFVLNQPTLPSAGVLNVNFQFNAFLNGLPGDTATVTFYRNGVVLQSWTQAINSVNTVLSGTYSATLNLALADCFWAEISTVRTCTAQINQAIMNIGTGYIITQNTGPMQYQASSTRQLIQMPVVSAQTYVLDGVTNQVVSYGFQYFRYLSAIQNPLFLWTVSIDGFVQGSPSQKITFDVFKNGVIVGQIQYNGATAQYEFNPQLDNQFQNQEMINLYDMWFIAASAENVNGWVSYVQINFEGQTPVYPLLRETYDVVSGVPNPQTAFNIADFTPMRMLLANGSILRSILYMIGPSALTFQTADKNQFLSTTYPDGTTITENASIEVSALGDPWWLPLIFDFDTQVPMTAQQIFDVSMNGYVSFQWKNKTFYGFPIQVSIKPAFNDTQTWKLLAAPANLLSNMLNLEWDGIQTLNLMDSMIPYISPLHFIPLADTKAARYNTASMDNAFYYNRIKDYCNKNDYFAPWQTTDTIFLQCQTAGLSPVTIIVLNDRGQIIPSIAPIFFASVNTNSILPPQTLWQAAIDLSTLPVGKYYFQWTMGTGAGMAQWISEGIDLKVFQPKTQLYEYTNSRNKLSCIFNSDSPWTPAIRMFSQINKYIPKSTFTTFVDEPQDIKLLNAIPYDTWNLDMGFGPKGAGMPDYMLRKMERIFDLDTVFIDGDQYSRDADAQIDATYQDGSALAQASLAIRKAFNTEGITLNTANQIEGPQQAGYIIDAAAFGNNTNNQNLIAVSNS